MLKHLTTARNEDKLASLTQSTQAMKHHRVFSLVRTKEDLQLFMQWHVFAVWEFMSLVKRLQNDFTCTSVPWLPPRNPEAAWLINDIILGEETDEAPLGSHASHFDLYLSAMREVGAPTAQIERFLDLMRKGFFVNLALQETSTPAPIAAFVQFILQTACHGRTHEVVGSFFHGQDDGVPQMFQRLLDDGTLQPEASPMLAYYLKRYVNMDLKSHSPAAQAIILETLEDDQAARARMLDAAQSAVEQRIRLWDALAHALEARHAAQSGKDLMAAA